MKFTYHCPKCKIERTFDDSLLKTQGLQLTKCPRCGAWMAKGPLPLEPPDPKELSRLEKALVAVKEVIARQRPERIEVLKGELARTHAEIARLQEQAAPEPDVEALLKDAVGEAKRLEEELREREVKTRELEARLHQAWPGEKELTEALRKWRAKYEGTFEKAVSEWHEQARAVGGMAGSPPGIDELLRRAWERVWAAK